MLDFSLPNTQTELSGCQMGKEKDALRKSQIIILVDDNIVTLKVLLLFVSVLE